MEKHALLTVKELRDYLGIGQVQAYRLTRSEGFPAIRFGRSIRIPREQLDAWIASQAAR